MVYRSLRKRHFGNMKVWELMQSFMEATRRERGHLNQFLSSSRIPKVCPFGSQIVADLVRSKG